MTPLGLLTPHSIFLCLRLMCALILHFVKTHAVHTHKRVELNAQSHTYTYTVDSKTDPAPSPIARISTSDG